MVSVSPPFGEITVIDGWAREFITAVHEPLLQVEPETQSELELQVVGIVVQGKPVTELYPEVEVQPAGNRGF